MQKDSRRNKQLFLLQNYEIVTYLIYEKFRNDYELFEHLKFYFLIYLSSGNIDTAAKLLNISRFTVSRDLGMLREAFDDISVKQLTDRIYSIIKNNPPSIKKDYYSFCEYEILIERIIIQSTLFGVTDPSVNFEELIKIIDSKETPNKLNKQLSHNLVLSSCVGMRKYLITRYE